jgi:uncharacterized protein YndB with AHSA1/START domain
MKQADIPPIEIHQRLSAPVEDVFDAWTDPLVVKKWMFLGEFNNIIQVIIDLQSGGEFSVVKKTDEGYLRDYYGRYHEVSRPSLLSFSLEAPDTFPGTSNIVLRFQPVEDGCEMVFLQTGVAPSIAEQPWRQMFEQLSALFARRNESYDAAKRPVDHHLL